MWQYTTGCTPLSQPPKPLMAIRSSSGFSHLLPRVFYIFYGHTNTTYTTKRVEEKRTHKHTLRLALSARKKKFVILFLRSVYLWANVTMYQAKFPQSHQKCWLIPSHWPTRPLGPHTLAVGFLRLLLTTLYCQVPCSADCPVLPPSLDWLLLLTLGPSFPRPLPAS